MMRQRLLSIGAPTVAIAALLLAESDSFAQHYGGGGYGSGSSLGGGSKRDGGGGGGWHDGGAWSGRAKCQLPCRATWAHLTSCPLP